MPRVPSKDCCFAPALKHVLSIGQDRFSVKTSSEDRIEWEIKLTLLPSKCTSFNIEGSREFRSGELFELLKDRKVRTDLRQYWTAIDQRMNIFMTFHLKEVS